jgi:RimJ/RimL family protein N-acetyltransferase
VTADLPLPLGPIVDPPPSGRRPERRVFQGVRVRLEPMDADRHGAELYRVSHGDPLSERLWTYLSVGPFDGVASHVAWLRARAAGEDPLFFAVVDRASGRAVGQASFLRIEPAMGVLEVGHIWYAPAVQRTPLATEAMQLMFRHAFDDLGYRRLEWKCDALNAPSRQAALRLGFTFEGVFRQHMIVKGRNRDTAWFALLDREWPRVRAALAAWLDPANFDTGGRQRLSLAGCRAAGAS